MRPQKPTPQQLRQALPLEVWAEAERQARRSPLLKFRTGAVLWTPGNGVISTGTSHHTEQAMSRVSSMHAEHHALRRASNAAGAEIVVVAIGAPGNWTHSACPCYSCARMLLARNIAMVHYALWNGRVWQVISETPARLLSRAQEPCGRPARKQRIPAPIPAWS